MEANKKAVAEFYDFAVNKKDFEAAAKFLGPRYVQHNPNAETGMAGFKAYFTAVMPKELPAIPDTLPGLVAIQAEGDYVTLSFVREYDDPAAKGPAEALAHGLFCRRVHA